MIAAPPAEKFAHIWYQYALPKDADKSEFRKIAIDSIRNGGCFCLSGLVQGLGRESAADLQASQPPATIVWGPRDFSHRMTDDDSVRAHLPQAEIRVFDECGHFPELERTADYVALVRETLAA